MQGVCGTILAISQQRDAMALAGLVAALLLLFLGDARWHPLFLWPLSAALALLAGGPPVCDLVLLRIAVGTIITLVLLITREPRSAANWRTRLASLMLRAFGIGLAVVVAVSLLEVAILPPADQLLWQSLASCGALGFIHTLVSRTSRGVAVGSVATLLVLEASLWLLRPSLLILLGCGAIALLVAFGGALHQDAQVVPTGQETAI